MHRWRRLYTPLEIVLPTVCYFHEAQVVAKNSSKQLICLLYDIVPFHLILQFIQLSVSQHPSPWDHDIGITELGSSASWTWRPLSEMQICGPIWARLGNIVQQPNIAYITQPISRSLPVRDIFPCPVANAGIEIKRKTRHAARTASTCFGTSTTLFERWRHIAAVLRLVVPLGLNSVTNTEDW